MHLPTPLRLIAAFRLPIPIGLSAIGRYFEQFIEDEQTDFDRARETSNSFRRQPNLISQSGDVMTRIILVFA
ncbi:MAG: hypothetical protein MI923_16655 [Phycisphaerales bacterium]|nr:hypothetical protein [Phycisphaerales bacterium]